MGEIEPEFNFFESETDFDLFIGEGFTEHMDRPVAHEANRRLRGNGENTYADLGAYGLHGACDVRFRDSARRGFLKAYIRTRELTEDHKVVTTITISTVAVGAVLTGIAALKHRK